jgi:hypothetical protein
MIAVFPSVLFKYRDLVEDGAEQERTGLISRERCCRREHISYLPQLEVPAFMNWKCGEFSDRGNVQFVLRPPTSRVKLESTAWQEESAEKGEYTIL